jgi:hypothetical protein
MNASIATGASPGTLPVADSPRSTRDRAALALRLAARAWFAVAAVGMLLFSLYVCVAFGSAALAGDLQAWNQVLPKSHVAGEPLKNGLFGMHLLLAAFITVAGVLQLIPQVRAAVPRLHRWIGRSYIAAVGTATVAGVALLWTLGTVGDLTQHIGMTLDAAVIWFCGVMAWRHAAARRIDIHRRWALRLFLAANGVWFFRIGLMLWLLIWQRPVGFDAQTFVGPFLSALAFAQFVVPLAVLELYFRAQRPASSTAMRWGVAVLLFTATAATAAGIFRAYMAMWRPHL